MAHAIDQESQQINLEYIHELFEYCSGELFWKRRPLSHFRNYQSWRRFHRRYAGKQAGTPPSYARPRKHRRVTINGQGFYLSRVIWLYHNGEWPEYCWHRDGDRQNCAIENLEALSKQLHLKRIQETSTYYALQRGLL